MNLRAVPAVANDTYECAADWHARLRSPDCSVDERAAFEAWCIEDSRNIEAWLELSEVAEHNVVLQNDPQIRAASRAAQYSTQATQRRHQFWRRNLGFATAAVLVLAVGILWRELAPRTSQFATAIGEQRSIQLEDGSMLVLDTDSRIVTRFDRSRRELEIEKGRVDIVVAEDVNRQFEVIAGNGRVRDIGTRFQVARFADDVTVTLIEGQVAVRLASDPDDERMLSPGQQLSYAQTGSMREVRAVDIESANAWTRGEVIMKDRNLDELIGEYNRYTSKPLRLAEPSLGERPVSGVFHLNDRASLLKALDLGWGIVVKQESNSEVVLEERKKP
jgi:transmembrane sensor